MTDLISSLADSIVALINSSPRSPTKEQIGAALRECLGSESNLDRLASDLREQQNNRWQALSPQQRAEQPCPGYASEQHHWEVDPWSTRDTLPGEEANRCSCGATRPIESDRAWTIKARQAAQSLIDSARTATYGGPTVEDREKFWANKLNEPFELSLCPGSTNGTHAWYVDGERNANGAEQPVWRCHCGARKP